MKQEEKEQLQEQIDSLQAKLNKLNKEEYAKEGWYYVSCGGVKGYLAHFKNPEDLCNPTCWFTSGGSFSYGGDFSKIERPAKHEEIQSALIKEAKRRGFKEGLWLNLSFTTLTSSAKMYLIRLNI